MTQLPDQTGRTFVVTGANSGLGLETTRALAGAGGHVVMAVRDTAKGESAARSVEGSTEVAQLDLADLTSVRAFAAAWDRPVDALVNNAGIMMVPQGRTADGFESQLGTNHLGHFALTNLLLPHVIDRVVTVSSLLHQGPPMDLGDSEHLDLTSRYNPTRAYQRSKLANLLFTGELARRLSGSSRQVRATAAHPGYSATNLQSHHGNPLARVGMWLGNKVVATSAAQGARPTLAALLDDVPSDTFMGPSGIGGLRGRPGPTPRSAAASDLDAAAQLWRVSEEATGVTFPF